MTCPPIELGSLVIDGSTLDANDILWTPTRLDGWWDSAPVRSSTQPAQPTGEYITGAAELGRALVLEVTASSPDPNAVILGDDCWTAIETMKAAARALFIPTLLKVTDPVFAGQAYVRRVGVIKQSMNGARHSMHFVVPLLAEDPRRYSQTLDSDTITLVGGDATETVVITTAGDVDTPFVVTFKGPTVNPDALSHSLGTPSTRPFFRWIGSLTNAADHLVVDTAAGTVLHNGVDASSGLDAGSQMFDLIPGANSISYTRTVTTGSSDAVITRRDARD